MSVLTDVERPVTDDRGLAERLDCVMVALHHCDAYADATFGPDLAVPLREAWRIVARQQLALSEARKKMGR